MTTSILSPASIADPNLLKKSCYFPPTLLTPTPTISLMTRRKLSNSAATSERPVGLSDVLGKESELSLANLPSVMDDAINVSIIPSSSLHDVPRSSHSLAAPSTPHGDSPTRTTKIGVSERDFWSSKMRLPTPFPEKKEGWLADSDDDLVVDGVVDLSVEDGAAVEEGAKEGGKSA